MKTSILKIVLPLIIGALFTGCWKHDEEKVMNDHFCIPDSLLRNITFDTIREETMTGELKLSGRITYQEDQVLKIFSLVSGHVTEVRVSLGDFVTKGQRLATVRSADMANYSNEYRAAKAELTIAKKNLDVIRDMRTSGVSSEKDVLTAQSQYEKAQAEFRKVNEVLGILGGYSPNLDSTGSTYAITAPTSGFIVEKNVNAGMEVRPDDAALLFTVSDLKEVWATGNVFESDIAKVKVGLPVSVTTISYPNKVFTGKVERVSNMIDPENNVMSIKVRLSNADFSLKPGMFAGLSITFPDGDKMLAVPARSILFDDNKYYVVRFNGACDVAMKAIVVKHKLHDRLFFQSSDLRPGDRVISRNGLFVFTALKKL